jgi:hypothetical protein
MLIDEDKWIANRPFPEWQRIIYICPELASPHVSLVKIRVRFIRNAVRVWIHPE